MFLLVDANFFGAMKSDTAVLLIIWYLTMNGGTSRGYIWEKIYRGIWKFPVMHKLLLIWSRHLLAF